MNKDQRKKYLQPVIQTVSGKVFNYLDPEPDQIVIGDIAHALSRLCRFAGHTQEHYSVAQHSVIMSGLPVDEWQIGCNPVYWRMYVLLHDAAEAYMGDMPSTLKQLIPQFKLIEANVEKAIEERFNLRTDEKIVSVAKHADLRMLATEIEQLMLPYAEHDIWDIVKDIKPLQITIVPWSIETAYDQFMDRFWLYLQAILQLEGAK